MDPDPLPVIVLNLQIPARNTYWRELIEHGHEPGVLDQTERRGRKQTPRGATYNYAYGCVKRLVATYNVEPMWMPIDGYKRPQRVWTRYIPPGPHVSTHTVSRWERVRLVLAPSMPEKESQE